MSHPVAAPAAAAAGTAPATTGKNAEDAVSLKTFSVHVAPGRRTVELRLPGDATIRDLHVSVSHLAQAELPEGAAAGGRILGLPKGDAGIPLAELKLKGPHRMVMMPSPTHVFGRANPTPSRAARWLEAHVDDAHACVLRDADEDAVSWSDDDAIEGRIALRVRSYDGWVKLSELDPRKRTAVIDLDFTVLDTNVYNAGAEAGGASMTPRQWRRPHVHEFLEAIAPAYNIIVWSATGSHFVESKLLVRALVQGGPPASPPQAALTRTLAAFTPLRLLHPCLSSPLFPIPPSPTPQEAGMLTHPRYRIALLLDYGAMIRIKIRRHGVVKEFNTKPLGVLFGKWPAVFNPDNTVIVDDHRRSFVLNAANGIHVTGAAASAD